MDEASEKNAILKRWQQVLSHGKNRTAIWNAEGQSERSFSDIEVEAQAWQKRLSSFPSHSVIALQFRNHAAWPALLLACWRCEFIPMPLAVDASPEACHLVGAQIRVVQISDELHLERLPHSPVDWPYERPEFIKFTSGTTSQPRAILFRATHLLADCQNISSTMGLRPDDRNFGVIPFSHSYGFSNLLLPLLCDGMELVCSKDPFPHAILRGLEVSQTTVLPGVPALFASLLKLREAKLPESLRLCISAGALLPAEVSEEFYKRFGVRIHSFYGASECGGICYDREGLGSTGFVGEVMENVRIAANPALEVRSDAVGLGYFPPDPSLSNGVFCPSDLLERSTNGWKIVGRTADFINIGANKVNPLQIEACLRTLDGIADCAVFGLERAAGSVLCAVVVSSLHPEVIRQYCARRLPGWQVPKRVFVVNEIPRNERGKLVRATLATQFGGELDRPKKEGAE